MHFKSRMEYRSNFISGIISNLYSYFISFISFWVLIHRFGTINGWVFEELCILYGFNICTYAIAGMFFWTIAGLEFELSNGSFDGVLIRPIGVIQHLVCKKFVDTFIGQIVISVVFLLYSITKLKVSISISKIIYIFFSLISGFGINAGAMILFGAISFWTHRSLPLMNMLYYNLKLFIQYPLSIFPPLVQALLTYILPWGFISYYPTVFILNKQNSSSDFIFAAISPIIGIIYYLFSIVIFYKGLRHYDSSGS